MRMSKKEYAKKISESTTLKIFRTVCDRINNKLLKTLPEREYHIQSKCGLNNNEINRRLAMMINYNIIKKVGHDKYQLTILGKIFITKIKDLTPKVERSILKRI